MERHRLKQLRDKISELLRFGSPSCMRQAHSIMRDEFENVLSFALELTEPEPKPKHTIADNYPAGGLTATEPCMFCKDNEKLINSHEKLVEENEILKNQARCPCGGELEGLGYDINTKDEVWQCKKCNAQIIIEQALKEAEKEQ